MDIPPIASRQGLVPRQTVKPVSFICWAPQASKVTLAGDFNNWDPAADAMNRQPDGAWRLDLPLKHGHHRYWFVVDGQPMLDPRAQGVARDDQGRRVSLVAVS